MDYWCLYTGTWKAGRVGSRVKDSQCQGQGLEGKRASLSKISNLQYDSIQTWDDITKTDGGHCYETEVESLKEVPLLPEGEEDGPAAEEDAEEADCTGDGVEVLCEPHLLLLLFLSAKWT